MKKSKIIKVLIVFFLTFIACAIMYCVVGSVGFSIINNALNCVYKNLVSEAEFFFKSAIIVSFIIGFITYPIIRLFNNIFYTILKALLEDEEEQKEDRE